ncbi:MAG: hypothetical protein MUC36_18115 [Planctomycetes bacterium]|jgi:hypothetical protein|nr:hypothetical protein [Planctomycetota bacterium]
MNADAADDDRPFPPESEWLDLPLPDGSLAEGSLPDGAGDSFVARTLQALAEEQELDRQLQRLDQELPAELLQQFAAPAPSRAFVERTMAALTDARRQHWQQLLARHVAPDPSPEFVASTLRALAAERGTAGRGSGRAPGHSSAANDQALAARRWRRWLLPVAAAAAVVWFALPRRAPEPLEQRLAAASSPAFAFHHGGSPLAAVLAAADEAAEPYALSGSAACGLWLTLGEAR